MSEKIEEIREFKMHNNLMHTIIFKQSGSFQKAIYCMQKIFLYHQNILLQYFHFYYTFHFQNYEFHQRYKKEFLFAFV